MLVLGLGAGALWWSLLLGEPPTLSGVYVADSGPDATLPFLQFHRDHVLIGAVRPSCAAGFGRWPGCDPASPLDPIHVYRIEEGVITADGLETQEDARYQLRDHQLVLMRAGGTTAIDMVDERTLDWDGTIYRKKGD